MEYPPSCFPILPPSCMYAFTYVVCTHTFFCYVVTEPMVISATRNPMCSEEEEQRQRLDAAMKAARQEDARKQKEEEDVDPKPC